MPVFKLHALLLFFALCAANLSIGQEQAKQAEENQTEAIALEPSYYNSQEHSELKPKAFDKNDISWLPLGDTNVFSLYMPENTGKARGGVIILNSHEQGVNHKSPLYNLLKTLNKKHWHALSVSMPKVKTDKIISSIMTLRPTTLTAEQSDNDNTEPASEGETTETTEPESEPTEAEQEPDYEALAQQHINAAVEFYNEKGVYNLVFVAEGSSGLRASYFLSQISSPDLNKQIRGLALVNAYNTLPGTEANIEALLLQLKLPILDIYNDDNIRFKRAAQKRAESSRALPKGQYQQIRLAALPALAKQRENRLSKRIRGWLDRTAAGFSVGVSNK